MTVLNTELLLSVTALNTELELRMTASNTELLLSVTALNTELGLNTTASNGRCLVYYMVAYIPVKNNNQIHLMFVSSDIYYI